MPLNWNIEEVEDYENVCFVGEGDERRLSPVTHTLIMATMTVGLGEISEKNAGEFYARLKLSERLFGPFMTNGDGSDHPVTIEEVLLHIGLRCNVRDEPRSTWVKRIVGSQLDEWKRAANRRTTTLS